MQRQQQIKLNYPSRQHGSFTYLFLGLSFLLLFSCNKWLDIQPKSDVAADELFTSETGFEEALNGVYIKLASSDLYGGELTTGLPDVLAQDYTLSTTVDRWSYFRTEKFDFKDNDFIKRRDAIWSGLYNAVVNLNLILENLNGRQHLFSGNHYNLIKGEALGLRAFLHFDLLRLFGSSIASGGTTGIPYVTTYSNKVTKTFSPREVMDAIEKDLQDAKGLLNGIDPIQTKAYVVAYPGSDTTTENADPTLFMQMRRNRFNYYAVVATLARVYLYDQKKTEALANALEVIGADKFPWTEGQYFLSTDPKQKDLVLYNEIIFGWYAPWMVPNLRSRFETGTAGMFLSKDDADRIYETNANGGEDWRFKSWLQAGIDGNLEVQKYARNPNADEKDVTANLYPQTLPAIRISEMFYIAAEASYDQERQKALGYVDSVLVHRGIGDAFTPANKTEFISALVREARKEFLAEGQIFYMYKRLDLPIQGHGGTQIPASPSVFVLPLPDSEIEFGHR